MPLPLNDPLLELGLFFIAGHLMKVADRNPSRTEASWGMVAGAGSGLILAVLMSVRPSFSTVVLAILAGSMLTGKVDCPAHWTGLGALVAGVLLWGVAPPAVITLLVLAVAATMDEVGDEAAESSGRGMKRGWVLKLRPFLKLTAVGAAIWALLPWQGAWAVLAFDSGYTVAEIEPRGRTL
ncbi:MAG: hypothetical protein QF415_15695 [Candidatus Undinarchaeales archaeon]|jgi:hypothetical protein|nr:hypothetical protein [Candidatus Undinarchaeales archaeon]MDP7492934.1 hypothetical protein [Candidatus Undinarchaeales archaeon]